MCLAIHILMVWWIPHEIMIMFFDLKGLAIHINFLRLFNVDSIIFLMEHKKFEK